MDVGNVTDKFEGLKKYNSSREHAEKNAREREKKSTDHENRDIAEVLDKLNRSTSDLNRSNEKVSFSFHEKTDRIIMKVTDMNSNEVIKEIPSKDAIKLLEHLREFIGILIDESR